MGSLSFSLHYSTVQYMRIEEGLQCGNARHNPDPFVVFVRRKQKGDTVALSTCLCRERMNNRIEFYLAEWGKEKSKLGFFSQINTCPLDDFVQSS